jgi:hypothetical protein
VVTPAITASISAEKRSRLVTCPCCSNVRGFVLTELSALGMLPIYELVKLCRDSLGIGPKER